MLSSALPGEYNGKMPEERKLRQVSHPEDWYAAKKK